MEFNPHIAIPSHISPAITPKWNWSDKKDNHLKWTYQFTSTFISSTVVASTSYSENHPLIYPWRGQSTCPTRDGGSLPPTTCPTILFQFLEFDIEKGISDLLLKNSTY